MICKANDNHKITYEQVVNTANKLRRAEQMEAILSVVMFFCVVGMMAVFVFAVFSLFTIACIAGGYGPEVCGL